MVPQVHSRGEGVDMRFVGVMYKYVQVEEPCLMLTLTGATLLDSAAIACVLFA